MPPPKGVPNIVAGPGDYITDPVHSDTYPAIDPTKVSLAGKTVFITGASKGIGRSISISYAKAGASKIAIGARSDMTALEQELKDAATAAAKQTPQVLRIKLDVGSRESIEEAAAVIEKEFGQLEILVNNAGVVEKILPVADSDPDDWWNTWTINVRGPYLLSRAFLPLLVKSGGGQIVNVSSVGAHLVNPGMSAYQPSKLALLRFTEFLTAGYGDQGLVAFSIHPGNIPTDLVTALGGGGEMPEDYKRVFVDTPELTADTIVYLTKEKRPWIGGRYINCTWDMPQLMGMEKEIVKENKLKVRLVV